jgi:sugar phosphate permease
LCCEAMRRFRSIFLLSYLGYISLYLTRRPFSLSKAAIEGDLGWTKAMIGGVDSSQLTAYAMGSLLLRCAPTAQVSCNR